MMKSAFEQTAGDGSSAVDILTQNFLKLDNAPQNIDLLITSPPYVTSYEYADLHQLSSLWLGYADDYRELRNGSIGSTQHDLDFNREIKRLNTVGSQIVFGLFDQDKAKARAAANYFLDMQAVSRRCYSLLRREGARAIRHRQHGIQRSTHRQCRAPGGITPARRVLHRQGSRSERCPAKS